MLSGAKVEGQQPSTNGKVNPNLSNSKIKSEKKSIYPKIEFKRIYYLKKGDSLWKVTKKVYGNAFNWPYLYWYNKAKLNNPNSIAKGTRLVLPSVIPMNENESSVRLASDYDPKVSKPFRFIILRMASRNFQHLGADKYGTIYRLASDSQVYTVDSTGKTLTAFKTEVDPDDIVEVNMQIVSDGRIALFDPEVGWLYQYDLDGKLLSKSQIVIPDNSFRPDLAGVSPLGHLTLVEKETEQLKYIKDFPPPPGFLPINTPTPGVR